MTSPPSKRMDADSSRPAADNSPKAVAHRRREVSAFVLLVSARHLRPGILEPHDLAADLVLVEHETDEGIHESDSLAGTSLKRWRQ